ILRGAQGVPAAAVLVDAIAADLDGVGVHVGPQVVAVVAAGLLRGVAVAIHVAEIAARAVLVHAVVRDLRRAGVHVRVRVVAVAAAAHEEPVAVAIVVHGGGVAILVHPVVG